MLSVVSPRRKATARMHASRMSKAKAAHRLTSTIMVPLQRTITQTATAASEINHMSGDFPPYNDKEVWINDPANHRAFLFGGIRPGDEYERPTSDFFCCDTKTMKWKDLSGCLKFCNPYSPLAEEELFPAVTPLPKIGYPGCTLLCYKGRSLILVFGGFYYDEDQASSKIIAIDPDRGRWYYLRVEGQGVEPRINPVVVAVDLKVYIFGGYRKFGDDCHPHNSFSVLEFKANEGVWMWKIADKQYTDPVPAGHVFGKAVSLYDGLKIFLAPGRLTITAPLNLTKESLFFYHTENNEFQSATAHISGDFPRDVYWYSMFEYQRPLLPSSAPALIQNPSSHPPVQPRRRGRPRKHLQPSVALPSPPALVAPADSVVICAWVPFPDTDDVVPEVWHLFLSPGDRLRCLNVKQKMWNLDRDFQGFLLTEGRLRIMGTVDDAVEKQKWNRYLDISLDGQLRL